MEAQLFPAGTVPEFTTEEWYAKRDRAPHLEEPGHRERLLLAAEMVLQAIGRHGITSVSDMGCGDGGLLSLLDVPGVKAWGYDLAWSNVLAAVHERRVHAFAANVLAGPVAWGDLAVCTEMLEHLIDPHGFVASIPSQHIVASSPAGETADRHYEFHTWAWDMDGYQAMFTAAGYEIVRHELVGGFQVLMAARP